ncbi:MAG: hypothetical protein ACJ75T_11680 [Solirubrobacterales bacterium]
MSKRLILLLGGVLALALVAAGCGSSDDSTTDTVDVSVTVTKPELIKQGDAICKKGNEEIQADFEQFAKENGISKGKEPNKAQTMEIFERVIIPNLGTQSELIRRIGAPEEDAEQIEEMLDSLDAAVEEVEDDPEALFDAEEDPFAEANEKAQAYGFSECGQS